MTSLKNLLENFNIKQATVNENFLFEAVAALITIVERQEQQIEDLQENKANKEVSFYG